MEGARDLRRLWGAGVRARDPWGWARQGTAPIPDSTRLVVVGCVAKKRVPALPFVAAAELYDSPLWHKRRVYAERSGHLWAVLSAEWGLVAPDALISAYDRRISDRPAQWNERVRQGLAYFDRRMTIDVIELHAGRPYLDALAPLVEGITIEHPVAGLQIGEQLAWYS